MNGNLDFHVASKLLTLVQHLDPFDMHQIVHALARLARILRPHHKLLGLPSRSPCPVPEACAYMTRVSTIPVTVSPLLKTTVHLGFKTGYSNPNLTFLIPASMVADIEDLELFQVLLAVGRERHFFDDVKIEREDFGLRSDVFDIHGGGRFLPRQFRHFKIEPRS